MPPVSPPRLSGRLKLLLSQHLADEEALLGRLHALATMLTSGGLREPRLAEQQPEMLELVRETQRLQQRRQSLRIELARSTAVPPEHVRLSRIDWGTPQETGVFQHRCDEVRRSAVSVAARLTVAGRTLTAWQRMVLVVLAEATGGHVAAERYDAAGRLAAVSPNIRVEMRS